MNEALETRIVNAVIVAIECDRRQNMNMDPFDEVEQAGNHCSFVVSRFPSDAYGAISPRKSNEWNGINAVGSGQKNNGCPICGLTVGKTN